MRKRYALVPQQTDHTCGIACLQTVARLLKSPVFPTRYMKPRLGTTVRDGTSVAAMTNWAKQRLPFESAGENTWTGGLAIALTSYLEEDQTETGHYEVFLGRIDDRIVSWCPWLATVSTLPEAEIRWQAHPHHPHETTYTRWSLNFRHHYSEKDLLVFAGMTAPKRLALPPP